MVASMSNIFRRGLTWCVRLHVPRDRQEDAAKALGARASKLREQWRSLETRDYREAVARRDTVLAEMRAALDARLRAKGLPPLTDWTASWSDEAQRLRANLEAASDAPYAIEEDPETGTRHPWTPRDLVHDEIREAAETLADAAGKDTASRFYAMATGGVRTLADLRDEWLAEVEANGRRKHQTVAGHRATLRLLGVFLKNHAGLPSLNQATLADVTRRRAADFIAWRLTTVSAKTGKAVTGATVKRELSSLSGLWRWVGRRDDTVGNPWNDQTADLPKRRRGAVDDDDDDPTKRPYSAAELVALLRAGADDWAPNGGGYGATLWDAVRLALLTGCRANELADLRCGDVVQDGTAISIRGGKTRNARRAVPLCDHAQRVVQARLASLPAIGPNDPLWPELPQLGADQRRGKMLSTRFGTARARILPGATGVDFHSFRRSFAEAMRDAMHTSPEAGNKPLLAVLMGHADGSLALGVYAPGAMEAHKRRFVRAMTEHGLDPTVRAALGATTGNRPPMLRTAPAGRKFLPASRRGGKATTHGPGNARETRTARLARLGVSE